MAEGKNPNPSDDLFAGFDEDELKLLGGEQPEGEPEHTEEPPVEPTSEEPTPEEPPAEAPEVAEWKEKYNNLLNALRESRNETQKWAGITERLVGRLEQIEKAGVPQQTPQEEELSEEERIAREQARKVLQPELAQRDQALGYLMEQQRLEMLQNEYAAKRAMVAQQFPDVVDAEVYASGVFGKFAEALFPDHLPNAQLLRNNIINDIRMLFYSHPEGPGAVYRAAKILGYGGRAATPAADAEPNPNPTLPPAQRSLSTIPGGKATPAKTLQERAEALIKMDDATFGKVDADKIEAVLKSLSR